MTEGVKRLKESVGEGVAVAVRLLYAGGIERGRPLAFIVVGCAGQYPRERCGERGYPAHRSRAGGGFQGLILGNCNHRTTNCNS